ncbi:MAG: uroporphyrinogen-III C-methyltransferase [Gammaproteobacteria bacterium]|nr:uroporphyrinogen-III C-methyltransferase [Gammaproteobacteria bacterium]
MSNNNPRVYLVGAGPGDPDLLTLKAHRLMNQADVIVYDRLVSQAIIDLIPHGTQRIYVGKAPGKHHMGQDEINQLLVKLANTSRKIVRLKGGDPYIFGRGSEEAQFLVQHGIDFEYVPGITAASACSAYAGIPLTHRGIARSVRFITGHCRADQPLELNWNSLADKQTTLVFYMGIASLPQLRTELIKAGLDASTPAAAVENGTTSVQRRCISTLDKIGEAIEAMSIQSPALIIIGDVVSFADELNWFTPQSETSNEIVPQAVKN